MSGERGRARSDRAGFRRGYDRGADFNKYEDSNTCSGERIWHVTRRVEYDDWTAAVCSADPRRWTQPAAELMARYQTTWNTGMTDGGVLEPCDFNSDCPSGTYCRAMNPSGLNVETFCTAADCIADFDCPRFFKCDTGGGAVVPYCGIWR